MKFQLAGIVNVGGENLRRLLLALWLAGAMAASAAAAEEVIPMGRTVGIRMSSDCVLVTKLTSVETIEGAVSPAQAAGLQVGELIRVIYGAPV